MACLFPFYVERVRTILLPSGGASHVKERVPVPCGKCPNCLVRRANAWSFRILHQERVSKSSHWITLTYEPHTVRLTPNGFMTLVKRDVQLFIKRLRNRQRVRLKKLNRSRKRAHLPLVPLEPIKYYCCGEYGSVGDRPHYHIILLNADERDFFPSWYDEDTGALMGDIYIDPRPLSEACIAYTVFYCNKGYRVGSFKRDDRLREFSLMSKGMGLSYLTPAVIQYHLNDLSRNFVTSPGGGRTALPRYYADRIFSPQDKENMQEFLQSAARIASQASYDSHVRIHGNADSYIRDQALARRAAIVSFQKKAKRRV